MDSERPLHRLLDEVGRALAEQGLESRFSHVDGTGQTAAVHAELRIRTADASAYRKILAGSGFVQVPATGRADGMQFLGFDRQDGAWVGLRLSFRVPRWLGIARPGRGRMALGRTGRLGLGVAVLGPDGAGKSSLIASLERSFPLPVRSIYMGLYQGSDAPATTRFTVPGVALASNLARQRLRWLRGLLYRLRGRLVLFDRYTYDAMLPADRPLSRLGRLRRNLLGHACPDPDLVVILDAPAEVLFERKGEHDIKLLDRHRRGLLQLAERLPHSAVVDAGRSSESVARDVTALIWERYRRRAR